MQDTCRLWKRIWRSNLCLGSTMIKMCQIALFLILRRIKNWSRMNWRLLDLLGNKKRINHSWSTLLIFRRSFQIRQGRFTQEIRRSILLEPTKCLTFWESILPQWGNRLRILGRTQSDNLGKVVTGCHNYVNK